MPGHDFIVANTKLLPVPLVPEISLHLAEESLPIWQKTETELGAINVPPPYWAFAWAGGQALARYVLDHASLVAGRQVLDLGAGSGLAAIAAAKAGAAAVLAAEIDALAGLAIELNARANGVAVTTTEADLLAGAPPAAEVILVGDLFYERLLAERVLGWFKAAQAAGGLIPFADPGAGYFPRPAFRLLPAYQGPLHRKLRE